MISFINAAFLLGLPLISAPIIIHLLNRRRRQVIAWGAMQFLMEIAPRRRRIWNLNELLLLLLRVLIVALFIFALAQPLLRISAFGISGPRDVILVIDKSMSTAQAQEGRSLFEKQIEEAASAIDRLNEQDTVRVLLAGAGPEWLVPTGIWIKPESKREIKSRLRQLMPSMDAADLPRSIQEALDAESVNEKATRVIVVLTDGQAHGWRMDEGGTWKELGERRQSIPAGAVINIVRVDDAGRLPANLSVDRMAAPRELAAPGETVKLSAWIRNGGGTQSEAATVAWESNGKPIGLTSLPPLAPGERTEARINHTFDAAGIQTLSCRIETPDDLSLDDTANCIMDVIDGAPVLIVDDAERADTLQANAGYLQAALGSSGEGGKIGWSSLFDPVVMKSGDMARARLPDYRCVILADVAPLSSENMARLKEFVERGGGLWIILGEATDIAAFNDAFHLKTGLSPLRLAGAEGDAGDEENYTIIRPPNPEHPATRILADPERMDIDRVRIHRRHRFENAGQASNVSILLAEGDGSPLALEKAVGRGRVIVQALPANVEWSNLPLAQSFVVLVNEWLWYLIEPSVTRWNINPGEAFSVRFPPDLHQPRAVLTMPGDETVEVEAVQRDGEALYSATGTQRPGLYKLALDRRDGVQAEYAFLVARDAEESNLSPRVESNAGALISAGLQFAGDPFSETRKAAEVFNPEPLWTPVLVALLIIIFAELLLAGFLSRQRTVQAPSLVMDSPGAGMEGEAAETT